MCGTCHRKTDPEFPSTLMTPPGRDGCGACHSALENADISWISEAGRTVRIASLRLPQGQEFLDAPLREAIEKDLAAFGFPKLQEGEEDLRVSLTVDSKRVREERFVPPGRPVFRCSIEARVSYPGREETLFLRRSVSEPRHGGTEEEAARRALADAYRVLRTHLIKALATN